MKKYLMSICLVTIGCGKNNEVSKTEFYDKLANENYAKVEIPTLEKNGTNNTEVQYTKEGLPITQMFVYDETAEYVPIIVDSTFQVNCKHDYCYTILGNSEKDIEHVVSFEELREGFPFKSDYVKTCQWNMDIIDTGSIEWNEHDYVVDMGTMDVNDTEWFYYIQERGSLKDAYAVYSNEELGRDLVLSTIFVSDDVELMKNNINVLLQEIDLSLKVES